MFLELAVALCTECLWTYCFSDLLFDLHYLMIIIAINIPTQFLMSSIVLTFLNYSGLLHLFFWLPWIHISCCVHQHILNKETEASVNSGKVLLFHSRIYYEFWFPWRRVFANRMFSQNRKRQILLPSPPSRWKRICEKEPIFKTLRSGLILMQFCAH